MPSELCNSSSEKLSKMNNVELMERCLEKHRPSWDEFFRRFIPVIKNAIKGVLEGAGYFNLAKDEDVVAEIFEKVFVKLYVNMELGKCKKSDSLSSWLRKLAQNQALSWLRWKKRRKRLPEFTVENSKISLSAIFIDGSSITVEDTLADDAQGPDSFDFSGDSAAKDSALPMVHGMVNEKKKWILRLSLVAYEQLNEDELKNLRGFNKLPAVEFDELISQMMNHVLNKVDEQNKNLSKAVMHWYEIRKLEYILAEKEKSSNGENADIVTLRDKIERKRKIREELLRKGKQVIKPRNRMISKLVGMPQEQSGQISVNLIRVRSEMRDKLL